jgi:hypothetical protein
LAVAIITALVILAVYGLEESTIAVGLVTTLGGVIGGIGGVAIQKQTGR